MMDVVQALVDKSLLRTWVPAEQGRYDIEEPYFGMYVSIHEYAAEKLDAERRRARARGARSATAGTSPASARDEALEALSRHGGVARRRALALELDNLVAACRRAVARGDGAIAVAAYRAAWEVLDSRGRSPLASRSATGAGARRLMRRSARQPVVIPALASRRVGRVADAEPSLSRRSRSPARSATATRRASLSQLGTCTRPGPDRRGAGGYEAALAIQREVGHRALRGHGPRQPGESARRAGPDGRGQAHFEARSPSTARSATAAPRAASSAAWPSCTRTRAGWRRRGRTTKRAVAIQREVGDRLAEGIVLGNLGTLHNDQGRMEEARADYEAALAIHREVGDRVCEGVDARQPGQVCTRDRAEDEARAHYEAALAVDREVGDRRGEGIVLGDLGGLHSDQGRRRRRGRTTRRARHPPRGGQPPLRGRSPGQPGRLLAAQGLTDEARAALRTAKRCCARSATRSTWPSCCACAGGSSRRRRPRRRARRARRSRDRGNGAPRRAQLRALPGDCQASRGARIAARDGDVALRPTARSRPTSIRNSAFRPSHQHQRDGR